jgi:hypothetical protein
MPLAARIPPQLWLVFATLIGGTFLLSDFAPKPSKAVNHLDVADLGATARQAMIEIFRNRDTTAIDRFFSEPFLQHDPNIADGLSGLKAFAAEVASSSTANVTIYRTLVDGRSCRRPSSSWSSTSRRIWFSIHTGRASYRRGGT